MSNMKVKDYLFLVKWLDSQGSDTLKTFILRYDINERTRVPCEVYWISEGIFKTDLRVDVEKTLRKCEKEKSIIEQINNVKYSFGPAKTYDPYFGKVYLELIQND